MKKINTSNIRSPNSDSVTYKNYLKYREPLSKIKTISGSQKFGIDNDIDTKICINIWLIIQEYGDFV